MIELRQLAQNFATGIETVDRISPPWRKGWDPRTPDSPGIGSCSETKTIELAATSMQHAHPYRYLSQGSVGLPKRYCHHPNRWCDIRLSDDDFPLYIEAKMLRVLNEGGELIPSAKYNIIACQGSSAVTDCDKLRQFGHDGRKAILIIEYDYTEAPMQPVIDEFETLASARVSLGRRYSAEFSGLRHPYHKKGGVFLWEVP